MKFSDYKRDILWMLLLIPVVASVIAILFWENMPFEVTKPHVNFIHSILMTAGIWIGCSLLVDQLWKKYPWEHYPIKHLIYEIIVILLFTNIFSLGLYKLEVKVGFINETDNLYLEAVITNLITFLITAIYEASFFYKQWKVNFSKSVKLEKDNIEAKYETLKSQINPHFLFNSLNSLTTIVEDNSEAVDYIQDLSEFLRYVLKSRDQEVVLLRDELSILEKYIKLQKSRFKTNFDVEIDIPEKYFHFATPPLVLQILVENCIKHNVISKEKPLKIKLSIDKESLSIENNIQKKHNPDSTGNGLNNIVERYRFFTTSEVKIIETNTTFKVTIPLLLVEL